MVLPEWIVKCCESSNLLPIDEFRLYKPEYESMNKFIRNNDAKLAETNEQFISSFYKSSRLHHLSTWKYELVEYTQQLLSELPEKPPMKDQSLVMHVDLDCFFASVALLSRPELVDKPVGVSHIVAEGSTSDIKSSTSSIASCNYIARSFGITNGMRYFSYNHSVSNLL